MAGRALEDLTSCDTLKLGGKDPLVQDAVFCSRCFGMSPARKKDATCFLIWIMSVIPDAVNIACYQKATKKGAFKNRVSSIILNVYQNAGIGKDDNSRQSIKNNAKIDEHRRFSNKKPDSSHDVLRERI